MILKQLDLRNIRSYETLESLTFDEGVSLLFGDVAAGKSSILYAIEFALFGLTGDLTGSKLLRRGSGEGSVALTFEQDGQQYTVTRALSQAGSGIRQADCALTANGDTKAYSVTDLKSEIIRILRFRERPFAKASSVIYRYGVFTPQEEMKEILWDKPDDRLQALRRAFRLDQYARAADNADELRRYLKNTEVAVLRGQARGLDDDKEALASKKATLEETRGQKDEVLNQIAQVGEAIGKLKTKQHQLEVKLEEVPSESELEALRNALELARTKQADLEQELLELDATEEALGEERGELAGHLRPTDKSDEDLSVEAERLEGERDDLIEKRGGIEQHIRDHEALLEEGECPTCGRTIEEEDEEDFRNRLDELGQVLVEINGRLGQIKEAMDQLGTLRGDLSTYLEKRKRIEEIEDEIEAIREKREEKQQVVGKAKADVERQQEELARKEVLAEKNEDLCDDLETVEAEIEEKQDARETLKGELGRLEERESALIERIDDLESDIEEKEQAQAKAASYLEVVRYLEDFFIPTVKRIEQVMLQAIRDEFDRYFQRFFETTIGETELDAYIDEGFSPVITEDGYEVPFEDLSGGEKTSLALAYRLALNLTVKKLSKLDKTLLILDEPTDGFSKEQVLNLREVLDAVGCDQTILVSHEEEIKGFADHAYGVEKSGRASQVTRL